MLTIQELRSSTAKELSQELAQARKSLQEMRITVRTKHQKNTSLIRKQKRYIARIQTAIKEVELEEMVKAAHQID